MKEFTNVAGNVTSFAGNVNFLFPSWISCTGGLFKKNLNFFESIFTPKEWFLSKKGPKEWREVTFMKQWVKPLYMGYLQALDLYHYVPCSDSENRSFENFVRSNSIPM